MKGKKLLAGILLLSLLVTALAVPVSAEEAAEPKEGPFTIGLLNPYIGNTWRAQYLEMAAVGEKIYQESGELTELKILTSNNDPTEQLAQMDQLVSEGVDAIILDPTSSTALAPGVEHAIAEGVLVVVGPGSAAYEGTYAFLLNDYDFAYCTMQWLIETLGGEGNIVGVSGLVGNPCSDIRTRVWDMLLEENPGVKMLASAPANWTPTEAQAVMSTFLSTYPEIDGVVQEDVTAPGVIRAYENAGKDPAIMTGDTTFGYLRDWEKLKENGFASIAYPMQTAAIIDVLGFTIKLLEGNELKEEFIKPNPFDENLVNTVFIEPPYIVTNEAQPDAPWMADKHVTESICIEDAVKLGEGQSDEWMLDGYMTEEQLMSFFK